MNRRKTLLTVLAYAGALALVAVLIEWLQWRHRLSAVSTEAYVVAIALGFTAFGLWVGWRLSGGKPGPGFERNRQAQETLGITEREWDVLALLGEGCSNQEIAERLFLSTNTVKTHLKRLYDKLSVARRTQAVFKARELRLIP